MFHFTILKIFPQSFILLGITFTLVCSHIAPGSSRTEAVTEGVSAVAIDQLTFYGDVDEELDRHLAVKHEKKRVGEQLSPEMVTKPTPDFFRGEIIDDSSPIKKYDWSKEKGGKEGLQPSKSTETDEPTSKVEITTVNANENATIEENEPNVDTPSGLEPVSNQPSMADPGLGNSLPNQTGQN